MPIVYYPCLTLGQAWNLIENLSAFLKYRHMAGGKLFPRFKIFHVSENVSLKKNMIILCRKYGQELFYIISVPA